MKLKYKDETVYDDKYGILNQQLLPIGFHSIDAWFRHRSILFERKYSKELLISCGVDNCTPEVICMRCLGLSLRDNYWICPDNMNLRYADVNLFTNTLDEVLSRVSLFGQIDTSHSNFDRLVTGELTASGTKAKCFVRENGAIYLIKAETEDEIANEVLFGMLGTLFKVPTVQYNYAKYNGIYCSKCQCFTGLDTDLIPYRDIMMAYNEVRPTCSNLSYQSLTSVAFVKMQILDYLSLNFDRNRDNYGVVRGSFGVTLAPLFDHDSAFKGKGENGNYFPTSMSFAKTLDMLKTMPVYQTLRADIVELQSSIYGLESYFSHFGKSEFFKDLCRRVKRL